MEIKKLIYSLVGLLAWVVGLTFTNNPFISTICGVIILLVIFELLNINFYNLKRKEIKN